MHCISSTKINYLSFVFFVFFILSLNRVIFIILNIILGCIGCQTILITFFLAASTRDAIQLCHNFHSRGFCLTRKARRTQMSWLSLKWNSISWQFNAIASQWGKAPGTYTECWKAASRIHGQRQKCALYLIFRNSYRCSFIPSRLQTAGS